ncbi:uncharacterized protein LOC127749131 [Frankliniella occidentalis]|uniref:Uncharacterized protein LOC127749131 n=1 Tax=Frankliniella occidentalis TaxID=133901 RepID=A0A9C6TX94_FRAOC|nr:uncharacterized protein LOC127749131 [Frankliniella occidentalis]
MTVISDGPTPTPCCGWLDGAPRAGGVVLVGDVNHVRRMLNHVRADYPSLWNGSAFFLFALCAVPEVRPDSLLRWLASKHLRRAAVAVEQRFGAFTLDEVPLFAALPPYTGIVVCQRDVENLTAVDVWLPESGTLLRDGEDLFAPRASPLQECAQCPLIATHTTVQNTYAFDEAIITEAARIIMSRMGCRLEVHTHNEVDFSPNRTWVGSFRRVLSGRADIVMRYLWGTADRYIYFDPSSTMNVEILYVHIKVEEPTTELVHTLALECVVVLALAFLAAVNHGCMALSRSLGMGGGVRHPFLHALMGVWALYADQPGTDSSAAAWGRPLWTLLALLAVVLNCVRSSFFASCAMGIAPQYIRTFDELLRDDVTIACHDQLLLGYLHTISPHVVDCTEIMPYCMQRLTHNKGDFALLLNPAQLYLNLTVPERANIYPLEKPFSIQPIMLYFAKDLPQVEPFSRMLGRMHASGLILENYRKATNYGITEARGQLRDGLFEPQSLSMAVLGPVVAKLALLLLPLSVLCFIGEVVVGNLRPQNDVESERAEVADAERLLDTRGLDLTWTVAVTLRKDAVQEVSLVGWSREGATVSAQSVSPAPSPTSWWP